MRDETVFVRTGWLALGLLAVSGGSSAAPATVPDAWRAVDALVAVDVDAPTPLSAALNIDLANGAGAEDCPRGAWTGQASFHNGADGTLHYWGTGWYCIPHGVGTIQFADGTTYFGRVTSFLASADARILAASFRPAVPDGPGQRFFPATGVQVLGVFARGQLARDLAPDPAFVARYAAAVESVPDRTQPTLTPAIREFFATTPSVSAVPPAIAPAARFPSVPAAPTPAAAAASPAPAEPASWEPKLLERVEPDFPREAIRSGISGKVVVEFDIRGDGSVEPDSLKFLQSSPPRVFDSEVRRAVLRWRFSPAADGDRTRRRTFEQTFNFRLEGG